MTLTLSPAELAAARRLSSDPVAKMRHYFGWHAWSKQAAVLRSVRSQPRTAVASCHGVGKTAVAARAVLDFITEPSPGGCRVITTAPTWHQVEELLWTEISVAWRDARLPLGGKLTKSKSTCRIEFAEDWFALGLSTDEPDRFQGHHAERLLLVVDEAPGVAEAIYQAAEGFQTAAGARILLIGNPTKMSGTFRRAFTGQGRRWATHRISIFDSPVYTGEPVPERVLRALPSREWAAGMAEEYGEDSPTYLARVLGRFANLTGRPFFRHAERLEGGDPVRRGRLEGLPARHAEIRLAPGAGPVTAWRAPDPRMRYVIYGDPAGSDVTEDEAAARADVAKGSERDAFVAYVAELDTGRIVAKHYAKDVTEKDWAHDLARLGYLYGGLDGAALLAVEKQGGYGTNALEELKSTVRYPLGRIYRHERPDHRKEEQRADVLGFPMNTTTRPQVLDELQAVIKDDPRRLPDVELHDEIATFIVNAKGKAGAASGHHDDHVMAAAGVSYVRRLEAQQSIRLPAPEEPMPIDIRRKPARRSRSVQRRAPIYQRESAA